MRNLTATGRHARRSDQGLVLRPQSSSPSTERPAPTPGLSLLAQHPVLEFPNMGGVRAKYVHEVNGKRLYTLCRALVDLGLGDERLWQEVGEAPVGFVQTIAHGLIDKICGDSHKDTLSISCEIRDNLGSGQWRGAPIDGRHLAVLFQAEQYGYVAIGSAIRALEEQARFLGASFYLLLCHSLYRWTRIYTHHDAEIYDETLHEWADSDDPQNRDSYEFPKLDETIPECVQVLEKSEGKSINEMRALLRRHRDGPYRAWIEKLLAIHRFSRSNRRLMQFEGEYDYPSLPLLLVVFRENDAVHACFDQESDSFNQGDNEPACAVCFLPEDKEDCDNALRTAATFLKLTRELAELIKLLNNHEEEDARQRKHRAQPALPTQRGSVDLPVEAGPLQ
jgi:hypothetical protein